MEVMQILILLGAAALVLFLGYWAVMYLSIVALLVWQWFVDSCPIIICLVGGAAILFVFPLYENAVNVAVLLAIAGVLLSIVLVEENAGNSQANEF